MDGIPQPIRRETRNRRRESLPDDIKMSVLESMLPPEMESHLQLNRPRFMDFDDVHGACDVPGGLRRTELGSTGKKGEDTMDVGGLNKGRPKGSKDIGKYIGVFSKGTGKEKETTKERAEEERKEVEKVLRGCSQDRIPRFFSTAASLGTSRRIAGNQRKAKVSPKGKKRTNSIERKEDDPEAETGYLEISMIEDAAMDRSAGEGEKRLFHMWGARNAQGFWQAEREPRWTGERSYPVSRYRQRAAAMAEAQLATLVRQAALPGIRRISKMWVCLL